MKFKSCDIGKLVRPKKLICLHLWNKKEQNIDVWWKTQVGNLTWDRKSRKNQLTDYYKRDLDIIFEELKLTSDFETSYIGEIVSFIVLYKGLAYLIESKHGINSFQKKIERYYGKDNYLPVVAVGLKFYKKLKLNANNELVPKDPWSKTSGNNSPTWFYKPNDLIPLENIIEHESIQVGDYLKLKKISGIVVKEKIHDVEQFYKNNSAVPRSLFLLTPTLSCVKIQPNRKLKK